MVRGGRNYRSMPYTGLTFPPVPESFVDGPVGNRKKTPRSIAEYAYVGQNVLVPDVFCPCTELTNGAGGIVDQGNGLLFASFGAVTYNETVAGYVGPWLGLVASSTVGFRIPFEVGWDPMTPCFVTFQALVTSTGGNRTLWTTNQGVILQLTSAGFMSLLVTNGTGVIGTVDHRHATIPRDYAILWDPTGPAPIYRVSSSLGETLSVVAGTGPGGIIPPQGDSAIAIAGKGFGGGGSSAVVGKVRHPAVHLGSAAIHMGDRGANGVVIPGSRGGTAQWCADRVAT